MDHSDVKRITIAREMEYIQEGLKTLQRHVLQGRNEEATALQ